MKTTFFIAIGFLILFSGCVNTYDPKLHLNEDLVVVTGIITDQKALQTITLNRAHSNADSSVSIPILQANVEILIDGVSQRLLETQPGTYSLPVGFQGKVGSTYQLRFRTAEGESYQSSAEKMAAVPPILKAYDLPHSKLVAVSDTSVPATDIFIDYNDPLSQTNFYFWRWKEYETQNFCASCRQGRYSIRDIGPVGSGPLEVLGCVVDPKIQSYVYFDYLCRSLCWDIFYSSTFNVSADIYTNGKPQVGHLVATIPAYQVNPALIVIEQLSISADAYRYYTLFADQVQNNGTLADSPPAPLAGNVVNVSNPKENVVGYFSAASVAEYTYKFTRQNLNLSQYIGLFRAEMNRPPRLEEGRADPIFGSQTPSALCIPSLTRTDQVPTGW